MTDDEYEALHAKMFKQIVVDLEKAKAPRWKQGISWFLDHTFWMAAERIGGIVIGFVLGALASHPLLTYDVVMHWVKLRLP